MNYISQLLLLLFRIVDIINTVAYAAVESRFLFKYIQINDMLR